MVVNQWWTMYIYVQLVFYDKSHKMWCVNISENKIDTSNHKNICMTRTGIWWDIHGMFLLGSSWIELMLLKPGGRFVTLLYSSPFFRPLKWDIWWEPNKNIESMEWFCWENLSRKPVIFPWNMGLSCHQSMDWSKNQPSCSSFWEGFRPQKGEVQPSRSQG